MKKLLILVALIGTLIPTIFVLSEAGGWQNWQGVLPRGQVDSLYYYARIHEVVDGYPLIGNPYFYEHRDSFTPGFFIPDIVSALPALIGVPFDVATVINMFVWSSVFLLLSFVLLRLLHMPRWWAFFGSSLMYAMAFSYIIRPTALQLIYPIFLVFLITLIKFLYKPLERRRWIFLSLAAALAFYAYTLLAYIIFLIFGLVFFWFFFNRQFKELRALVASGLLTSLLLVPYGIYTAVQMSAPYYLETWMRMGLVYSHIPAIEFYYYGRWIIIGLVTFGLLWFFFPKKEEGGLERKVFWFVTGASLFGGLLLNVATGVDVSLAIHTGRFFFVWMTMILSALAYKWYISRLPISDAAGDGLDREIAKKEAIKYISAIFIILLSIGVVRNIPPGPSFFAFNKDGSFSAIQSYAGPLNWLEDNVSEQSVIWANESISAYIPIMTRHYVLFHGNAKFHVFPGEELEDRYLLSRSLNILTTEDLKNDFFSYTGLNSYLLPHSQKKREEWMCVMHLNGSRECPPPIDAVAFRGEEYFEVLEERFDVMKSNRNALLQQYNVKYLIIDRFHDNLEHVSTSSALYDDGRFVILPLPLFPL